MAAGKAAHLSPWPKPRPAAPPSAAPFDRLRAGSFGELRAGGYVELHAHSDHSLLDGVPSPEALVARAAELGMDALALTDHDGLYGAVRFVLAAREA
ncbi:MAG TPA: PHP domain-containing protein, partial [Anaerolineae bacterium]|nr:PHP domain-containing protein [Anaerolineae bacterium]